MKCRNCGEEMEEQLLKCPYCNTETGGHPPETGHKNTYGIAGLILGIIGLVLSCVIVGIVPAVIGLVFSILGARQKGRKGLSIAGCICSGLAILIALLVFLVLLTGDGSSTEGKNPLVSDISTEQAVETEVQKETEKQEHETTEDKRTDASETETEGGQAATKESAEGQTEEQETAEDYADYPGYSLGYLYYYLSQYKMEAYQLDTSKEEEKIYKKNADPVSVAIEKGGLFGDGDYYARTKESSGEDIYWYAGDLKDNRPDGFGSLYRAVEVDMSDSENGSYLLTVDDYLGSGDSYLAKVYVGQFTEGRFDGTGIKYYTSWDSQGTGPSLFDIPISANMYQLCEGDVQQLVYLAGNPVCYVGEFEKGEYSGKGSTFYAAVAQDEETGEVRCGVSATTGEFKDGKANGKVKEYTLGYLSYDGEMKDDQYDGEGTTYYYLTNQKAYVGGLKNGVQNGQGTEYDRDGNVVYSGEWSNGDYAN